ncbi:hypothetical protein [Stakelama tenebrarum]|uniref:Uncharacterized protein n=1 Tax=Stakelama tenebrarum TaxID=2711215 RepID=A0A6G6Y931_9SPHN|nr:hypothetical protein [Sphingosinithalassobacter tenebrarum]QIG81076.1 hypothetical protein G5C33_15655 [Sphingosinithalassobacter tenebrarum]
MPLSLPMAVFGPLANGADVRLLARPEGNQLSSAAQAEFSRFYYAGWQGSAVREKPYWAFFRLDSDYWGLAKSEVIAKRSMGVIFVSWLLLLTEAQLNEIGWQTYCLWNEALPAPLRLLEPGTRLAPAVVRPHPEYAVGSDVFAPAENLAFSISAGWDQHRPVFLPSVPSLGGTPESTLAIVQKRLGTMIAGHSYATWPGIEDHDFQTLDGPFDLLVGERPAAKRERLTANTETPPTTVWLDRRQRECGIEGVPKELNESDLKQIAEARFEEHRKQLVERRNFGVFGEIARSSHVNSFAAPTLLFLVVDALPPADKVTAIDTFVADALKDVREAGQFENGSDKIAIESMTRDLIFRLAPHTIAKLHRSLFGTVDAPTLTSDIDRALDRQLARCSDWSWAAPATLREMAGLLEPSDVADRLRNKLLATLGAMNAAEANDDIAAYLDTCPDFGSAWSRYHSMSSSLPERHRTSFEKHTAPILEARALDCIRNPRNVTEAMEAIVRTLFMLADGGLSGSEGAIR